MELYPGSLSCKGGQLGCFVPRDPEWSPLCPLGMVRSECRGFRKVQVLVDSGAAASVLPIDLLDDYQVTEGEGKKNGVMYTTADGGEIPNLGEKRVAFKTREGIQGEVDFQVADVKRPLLSVTAVTKRGSRVVFDETGGQIVSPDGEKKIKFHRRAGVYVLDLWVPPFRRQGE